MITVSTALPEAVDVELEPDTLLGSNQADGGNRASFGGPEVTPLTAEALGEDPELNRFAVQSGYDYYLLGMTLSLAPREGAQIRDSTVAISLTSGAGPAIAWSMSPLRLAGPPVTRKRSATIEVPLGPMLKIGGVMAVEATQADPYVLALGELESLPEWRLRRTATADLSGVHELTMVVRGPRAHQVDGQVQINATVAGTRGLFRSRAALPASSTSFVCSG